MAFKRELRLAGMEVVGTLVHPARSSAPAKWVEELAGYDPDLVLLYTYVKPASDLLRAAHAVGFHPAWLASYVLSGPDLLRFAGSAATRGLRAACYPAGPRHHRGERLFRKLMARSDGEGTPSTHSRIGYAAAQLIVEGLKRAGPDLTREGFIAALEGIEDWTGGLLPPIRYSATDHRGLTALALQRAVDGRWLVERGLLQLRD